MLKGGVIMDVVTPDQAKIAEDAGAASVMALERVPADIRRDGGVARMSDPEMIEGIKAVVTIPVMAKARIGHFAEAQILEALGVDYVDESEVLTPADEAHHIDKWRFTVPFVCGATNLGEALRRISEGAAMIRSKGEAGTGNIVEAVRHLRSILGDIRKITQADSAEVYDWAKRLQSPVGLVQEIAETGRAAGAVVLCRRHRHAGRRVARDATRRRGGVRRFGHLQVRQPAGARQGDRRGDDALPRPRHPCEGQPRSRHARCAARTSASSTSSWPSAAGSLRRPAAGTRGASRSWLDHVRTVLLGDLVDTSGPRPASESTNAARSARDVGRSARVDDLHPRAVGGRDDVVEVAGSAGQLDVTLTVSPTNVGVVDETVRA